MDNSLYRTRVAKTIRLLRQDMKPVFKQEQMALALNMTQSNYSKIEQGLRPISLEQLHVIAVNLNTSAAQILLMSETEPLKYNINQLKDALIKSLFLSEGRFLASYSKDELKFAIDIVVDFFETKSALKNTHHI